MKKILNYIKNNKKTLILLSITISLFILLSYLIFSNRLNDIDTLTHTWILKIRNKNLNNILQAYTNMGGATFLIILSIILLIFIKKKKIPLYILINLVFAFLTNEIAKNIFSRSRPIGINLVDETGLSYPSGHSMVSLAYYGFIAYLLYKRTTSKLIKTIIWIILTILISIIGFSRIYLGVHYLTDVIGGFLLAIIYLTIYIKTIQLEKK